MRPADFIPDLKKGEGLLEQGRFDETLALCEKVLSKMPNHAGALDLKCVCYLRMQRLTEAEAAVRLAIKELDGNAALYSHLGEALEAQGKSKEALEAYEKAVRFDGRFAPGVVGRGRIRMFDLCDSDGSLKDFTKALELDPSEAEAWFLRGICRLGTQEIEAAQRDFKEALKLNPGLKDRVDKAMLDYMEAADLPEA